MNYTRDDLENFQVIHPVLTPLSQRETPLLSLLVSDCLELRTEAEQLKKRLEEAGRASIELALPNKTTTWHCFQDDNNNPIMKQLHCDSCEELKQMLKECVHNCRREIPLDLLDEILARLKMR